MSTWRFRSGCGPIRWLLVAMPLAFNPPAMAADYYVDATAGSDSTGDGSQASPWKTLSFAVSHGPVGGDHIWLEAGLYDFTGNGESFPIFFCDGISLHGSSTGSTVIRNDAPDVSTALQTVMGNERVTDWVIERLTFEGVAGKDDEIALELKPRWPGLGPRVRQNVFRGYSTGLTLTLVCDEDCGIPFEGSETYAFVEGNLFEGNGIALAIVLNVIDWPGDLVVHTEIVNNIIVGNRIGILAHNYAFIRWPDLTSQYNLVVNNTIAFNGEDAIRVWQGPCLDPCHVSLSAVNNIMAFNGGWGIHLEEGWDDTEVYPVAYNTFWDNASGPFNDGPVDRTNFLLDPLLADPANGDYHLSEPSPCIDSGTDDGAPGHDFELDLRPLDGDGDTQAVTDMGADEYRPDVPLALRRADFSSVRPVTPAMALMFPFSASNPLTPSVLDNLVSGAVDPDAGILGDPQIPMAFYQLDPDFGETILAVKDVVGDTLRFELR